MTAKQTLTMRAILPEVERSNARNLSPEKETIRTIKVVGKRVRHNYAAVIAEARFYMGRSTSASTVYCSLWVHGDKCTSGHGKASGYGYHKESAALQDAIESAGIELRGSNYAHSSEKPNYKRVARIDGCGDSSMEMALMAIARAAGARGKLLVV